MIAGFLFSFLVSSSALVLPDVPDALKQVIVDKSRQRIFLCVAPEPLFIHKRTDVRWSPMTENHFDKKYVFGSFHVCTGKHPRATPTGTFTLLQEDEAWARKTNEPLPDPVRIPEAKILLHGYHTVPNTPKSGGCIREPLKYSAAVRAWLPSGTFIHIVDSVDEQPARR